MDKVVYELDPEDEDALYKNQIPPKFQKWLTQTDQQKANLPIVPDGAPVTEEKTGKLWHIHYSSRSGDVYVLESKGSQNIIHVYYPRGSRHYQPTVLPTLLSDATGSRDDFPILQLLYTELSNNWRQLTDVRFKLLALVPTVSLFLLVGLLSPDTTRQDKIDPASSKIVETTITKQPINPLVKIAIAFLGLSITGGLYIYEIRNSDLYNDLTSRARRIETELKVDTGIFRGRPEPEKKLLGIIPGNAFVIEHSLAINIIYWASILGWILALAYLVYSYATGGSG
ncbi:MAG TPA: hypothetical protein VGE45_11160 [Chloroflexia bacterium]|jgi:hypothetical protein